jgi:hypothetical protein
MGHPCRGEKETFQEAMAKSIIGEGKRLEMSGKAKLQVCDFEKMTPDEKAGFIRWLRFEADFFESGKERISEEYNTEWKAEDVLKWNEYFDRSLSDDES